MFKRAGFAKFTVIFVAFNEISLRLIHVKGENALIRVKISEIK